MANTPPGFYGSCARKSAYPSEKKAKRYARKYEDQYGVPMRAYYCGVCDRWHLTTWRDKPEDKEKKGR